MFNKVIIVLITMTFFCVVNGAAPEIFTVTTTSDTGAHSLRWAIEMANQNAGADTIEFNISLSDPGFDGTVWWIRPNDAFPPFTDSGTFINGASQDSSQGDQNQDGPDIVLDGRNIEQTGVGLLIYSSSNTIYGLTISGFKDYGIRIREKEARFNRIIGCYIGTTPFGRDTLGNGSGIFISKGSSNNTIGGENIYERNIISGNYHNGIYFDNSDSNLVIGNLIGTDPDGTLSVPNGRDGKYSGILIADSSDFNIIGGSNIHQRNIISGNGRDGIKITVSEHNIIIGNFIGVDITGVNKLGNGVSGYGDGIDLRSGSKYNRIGGSKPGERNVISNSTNMGIRIYKEGTEYNTVCGNYVGTDSSGTVAFGNGDFGIYIYGGSSKNIIGGYSRAEMNLISGNSYGVYIQYSGTDSNLVLGNFIGTDYSGKSRLSNLNDGIYIASGAKYNQIGPGNIISGNSGHGIQIYGEHTDSNSVIGNWVGLDVTGLDTLSNSYHGIVIRGGARYNTIGGCSAEDINVVSGNRWSGIVIRDDSTGFNVIQNNYCGTDTSGNAGAPNLIHGGYFMGHNNVVVNNIFSGNRCCGIAMAQYSNQNVIRGNLIGIGADSVTALPNYESGIRYIVSTIASSDSIGPGNRIWYNRGYGIELGDSTISGITITCNSITMNDSGGIVLKNGANGGIDHPVIDGDNPVHGVAAPNCRIEIYSDSTDQGMIFEGSVESNGAGEWIFNGSVAGPRVTAIAIDDRGNTSSFSDPINITSIENKDITDVPERFRLYQNFPNPFNSETVIRFEVKRECHVLLKVYNLLGQEILKLIDKKYFPGEYEVLLNSKVLSSGIYIYQIQMDNFKAVRKMVLLE